MFRNCEKISFVCCAVYMNIGKLEKWESCPLIVLSCDVMWDNVVKLEILKDAVFVYWTLFSVQQTTHVHFKGVSRRNPCNALHFVGFTLMSPCQFFLLRCEESYSTLKVTRKRANLVLDAWLAWASHTLNWSWTASRDGTRHLSSFMFWRALVPTFFKTDTKPGFTFSPWAHVLRGKTHWSLFVICS